MTALPTDKPILFSAPMVRSLRANLKTKTRRGLTQLRGKFGKITEFQPSGTKGYDWTFRDKQMRWHDLRHDELLKVLKYQVGDNLWVRETWANVPPVVSNRPHACYRADYFPPLSDFPAANELEGGDKRWRPSIFMPRWASRINLKVTAVKIERLQDISEADAIAEGVERLKSGRGYYDPRYGHGSVQLGYCATARDAYALLWESINGEGSWDQNPYVVACSFERVQ